MLKRSGAQVVADVWKALFLRETLARISADRLGWSWLFIEPMLHVGVMIAIRALLGRTRVVPGAEFIPYLIVGMFAFFTFRSVVTRTSSVVSANMGLFAYRQVHPIDTVMVRAILEGLLQLIVFSILLLLVHLLGLYAIPAQPLQFFAILLLVWWLGLGLGMVFCVLVSLFEEMQQFIGFIMMPLYFLSGVLIPVQILPHAVQEWLWWNPVLHAVELGRLAYFPGYQSINNLSVVYLAAWGTALVCLGMMLQLHYRVRMLAR